MNGGVRWTAHWLAVEGIMPRVPENVAPDHHAYRAQAASKDPTSASSIITPNGLSISSIGAGGSQLPIGKTKPHLSQELQLYFSRLTKALMPLDAGVVTVSAAVTAAAGGVNGGEGEGGAAPSGVGELTDLERARLAALASLRGDTGLQGLVVYLVRWVGERVSLVWFA